VHEEERWFVVFFASAKSLKIFYPVNLKYLVELIRFFLFTKWNSLTFDLDKWIDDV